jgi:hypothetical protein
MRTKQELNEILRELYAREKEADLSDNEIEVKLIRAKQEAIMFALGTLQSL